MKTTLGESFFVGWVVVDLSGALSETHRAQVLFGLLVTPLRILLVP